MYRTGIGQDSHRFLEGKGEKLCKIGGVEFTEVPGMDADSDGDVILHSICNAISSITHLYVLGEMAPKMCHEDGIEDSAEYLKVAMSSLENLSICHVSLTVEGARPRLQSRIREIREKVASLMNLPVNSIGLTCTSGDRLSDFARGDGLQCFAVVTVKESAP